ncbi:MAG: hypothetical protein GWM90_17915 [Gemmatimonadetes bacterium]|nr:hypothetical protein [Gemmatimonadota bacterium]NIU76421.1 hypothetical protein [Gammaproteobacteria bacterium]NIP80984.1 hypothetical protein [Gemmatimonadota bacterium]NIQ56234.1 hypothetical protein [Gemmatimonadota bacterium]NIW35084.1 hypothetical protein [Gemmatimonadota bacterium]
MTRIGTITAVLLLTACGGGSPPPLATASPGPVLIVERFLQAANSNDLSTMTELFGTADRTIVQLDGREAAEQRMYVLASLLRHDDFTVLGQQRVPGRLRDATELLVELHQGEERVVVPHLVVRRKGGGWVIERIDVEPLTRVR